MLIDFLSNLFETVASLIEIELVMSHDSQYFYCCAKTYIRRQSWPTTIDEGYRKLWSFPIHTYIAIQGKFKQLLLLTYHFTAKQMPNCKKQKKKNSAKWTYKFSSRDDT